MRSLTPLIAATVALLTTALPSAAAAGPAGETLANARDATAAFNDPAVALAAGYDLLTDAAGLACIDQQGAGAMGVHYVKGALVQSGALDPARPQALVYEVQPDGQLRLAALEYVVFQSAWDGAHSGPPTLFGQQFMLNADGNRFGLPAFYALHAWVWKSNPSGTFQPYNPDVRCGAESTADEVDSPTSSARQADGAADEVGMYHSAFLCAMPMASLAQEAESPEER